MIHQIHQPVLLKEAIKYLDPKQGETILDATIDGGGHAFAICVCIGTSGRLVGLDQDVELLKEAELKIKNAKCRTDLLNGNFRNLDKLLESLKIRLIDAALFDLGMSSFHLEKSGRGFTFQKDEPLIMNYKLRLEPQDLTAGEILNKWREEEIFRILKEYGEERYARKIAKNIIEFREHVPLKTTFDLVGVVKKSVPSFYIKKRRIHPATLTFQALRMVVNDELGALKEGLAKAWNVLEENGRLVVISFHSLEDRIVKNFFRDRKNSKEGMILTKKPIMASEEEIKLNPRARSAKLRAIKKQRI